ncbi:MAG: hypothetical protein RLZZ269_472 [Actinomycetota bacterium]
MRDTRDVRSRFASNRLGYGSSTFVKLNSALALDQT